MVAIVVTFAILENKTAFCFIVEKACPRQKFFREK
jgi:hypothetical protein